MSNYQTILYDKQRHGVLITLNRPNALNAINEQLWNELDNALADAETDAASRVLDQQQRRGVIMLSRHPGLLTEVSADQLPLSIRVLQRYLAKGLLTHRHGAAPRAGCIWAIVAQAAAVTARGARGTSRKRRIRRALRPRP